MKTDSYLKSNLILKPGYKRYKGGAALVGARGPLGLPLPHTGPVGHPCEITGQLHTKDLVQPCFSDEETEEHKRESFAQDHVLITVATQQITPTLIAQKISMYYVTVSVGQKSWSSSVR